MKKSGRSDGLFTIGPEDVAAAMKAGFSFVCAMCVKLHAGREAYRTKDWKMVKCLGEKCCGPMGGGGYPEYQGPLGAVNLPQYCFRCGRQADAAAESIRDKRMVGVCEQHLELLRSNEYDRRQAGTSRQAAPRNPIAELINGNIGTPS